MKYHCQVAQWRPGALAILDHFDQAFDSIILGRDIMDRSWGWATGYGYKWMP